MPRVACLVEYDGTGFNGWQIQDKEKSPVTVQGVLESALAVMYPVETPTIVGAGRTDTGVHATGQWFHVDLPELPDLYQFMGSLNGITGKHPVTILKAVEVDNQFHARFSAISRSYIYKCARYQSPLQKYRELVVTYPVGISVLNQLSDIISIQSDFTSFCRVADQAEAKTCRIMESRWVDYGERFEYRVKANRFLYGMVRTLVGTQLRLASTDEDPIESLKSIFKSRNRENAFEAVRPWGLYLSHIDYPSNLFKG